MASQSGKEVESVLEPLRPGELIRSCLDVERAAIQLGWRSWTQTRRRRALPCSNSCAPPPRLTLSGRGPRPGGRITSARTEAGRSHSVGTPRTTATGTPRSLPMTSSAAEASSSATQISVATSSRPPGVGRALQVDHGRHAGAPDGDVGDAPPPGSPEGVRDDHTERRDAEAVLQARPDAPGASGPSPRAAAPRSRRPRWRGPRRRWHR